MFDPYGAERHGQRARQQRRAARAGRHFGGHAWTAFLSGSVACGRAGFGQRGYPGHAAAATVSAGGHGPAVISLSW